MNSYAPLSTGSSNDNTTSTQRTRLDSTDSIVYIDESESDEEFSDDKSDYHHVAEDDTMRFSPIAASIPNGVSTNTNTNTRVHITPAKQDFVETAGDVKRNTKPTEVKKATEDKSNREDFGPNNNFDFKDFMQYKLKRFQKYKDITESSEQFKTSVKDRQVDQRDKGVRCSCESGKDQNKVETEDEVKVKPMETISRETRHNDDKISHYSADFDPFTDSKLNLYEPRLKDSDLELFLRRDKNIHEYQNMNKCLETLDISHRRTLDDFRRKLAMLKTQCLVLTGGLVIIIIFYAATTVYYLSNGTSRYDMEDIEFTVERFLDSSDVRKDFRNQVLCVTCDDVSYDVMPYFRRQDEQCCIKDMGSLSHSLKTSFSMDVRNQNARLFNLTKKFSELEQKVSYQNFVLNVGEDDGSSSGKVVKYDKVLEEAYAKIEKNERMINTILERQRSSLHIVGRVNNDQLRWEYKDGSIKPKLDINSVTFPINGGTYFLYGNIKFSCKNSIKYDRVSVGYQLDELGFRGRSQIIASVQQECLNGTNSDIDVVLQQIISVPLNQGKNVRFTLFDATSHFVSDMHDHSFGLFEI